MTRKPPHGDPAATTTMSGGSAPVPKDPVPIRACWHDATGCGVAIHGQGSPDLAERVAAFEVEHPDGRDGHRRVKRLPGDHGDVAWGWTPGAQKRVSVAPARKTPEMGAAGVLARSQVAAERIPRLQGGPP